MGLLKESEVSSVLSEFGDCIAGVLGQGYSVDRIYL